MRLEAIDQAVAARADFRGGSVSPVMFRLGEREHRVTAIHARWVDRAGRHPRFFFSVTTHAGDVYQLQLNAADMVWRVDHVTLEG